MMDWIFSDSLVINFLILARNLTIASVGFFGTGIAFGEQLLVLDRDTAVEIALNQSFDLKIALEEVQRADGVRIVRRAPGLPSVSVSGNYERRESDLIDRAPSTFGEEEPGRVEPPPSSEVPISTESLRIRGEVRQRLIGGGEQQLRRRAAESDLRSARLSARDIANSAVRGARVAFETALLRRDALALMEESLHHAKSLEEAVLARAAGGQVADFQVIQARINRSRAEVDLERSRLEYAAALSELADEIGLAAKSGRVLRLEGKLVPMIETLPTVNPAMDIVGASWRVRSLDFAVESANLEARAEGATGFPVVEGYLNYQYNGSYYDFDDRLHGWAAGLALRWDLFDGFARRGRIRIALAEKRRTEWEKRSYVSALSRRFENVHDEISRGLDVLRNEDLSLDLALESLEDVGEMYDRGSVNLETLLAAREDVMKASLRRLEAIYRLNVAWFQYLNLTGGDEGTVLRAVHSASDLVPARVQ